MAESGLQPFQNSNTIPPEYDFKKCE